MKKIFTILLVASITFACKTDKKVETKEVTDKNDIAYTSIGKEIIADDALTAERMKEHYEILTFFTGISSREHF